MIENNENSGCLTVINNNYEEVYLDFCKYIQSFSINEWNMYDMWEKKYYFNESSFPAFYKLNKEETTKFNKKEEMPSSFIAKFINKRIIDNYFFINKVNEMLFHKKNPNTEDNLLRAIKNKQLIKVKCAICGKTYFTDSKSFGCVKWKSCCGAGCFSSTIKKDICDYSKSICCASNKSNKTIILNEQLKLLENVTEPLSYYGGINKLRISYISDLHLLHHLPDYHGNLKMLINDTVKKLYETLESTIIIAGDIASNKDITIDFLTKFVKYNDFLEFKHEKNKLNALKSVYKTNTQLLKKTERNLNKLQRDTEKNERKDCV